MSRKMLCIMSVIVIVGLLLPIATLGAGNNGPVNVGAGRVTGGAAMWDEAEGVFLRVNIMVQYDDPDVRGFVRLHLRDLYVTTAIDKVTEMDPAYVSGGVMVGKRAGFEGTIVDTNFPGLEGLRVEFQVDDRGTPGTGYNRIRWDVAGIGDTGWIETERGNLSIHIPPGLRR